MRNLGRIHDGKLVHSLIYRYDILIIINSCVRDTIRVAFHIDRGKRKCYLFEEERSNYRFKESSGGAQIVFIAAIINLAYGGAGIEFPIICKKVHDVS